MIALFGGKGSIGRRYAAILKYLEEPFQVIDIDDQRPNWGSIDKAIIATPTPTHVEVLNEIPRHIDVLCEKPVSKDPDLIPDRENCFVVSNYRQVVKLKGLLPPYKVWYSYYNTGSDGLLWDCCQLIYLDEEAIIDTDSPRWNLSINGHFIKYRDLEESYVRMISDFVGGRYFRLWGMDNAREMTKAVIRRLAHEDYYRDTSKIK